jgi:hypothetical protein
MGLCEWMGICLAYIGFRRGTKAQGLDRKTLPFASPIALFGAWFALISFGSEWSKDAADLSHHLVLRVASFPRHWLQL